MERIHRLRWRHDGPFEWLGDCYRMPEQFEWDYELDMPGTEGILCEDPMTEIPGEVRTMRAWFWIDGVRQRKTILVCGDGALPDTYITQSSLDADEEVVQLRDILPLRDEDENCTQFGRHIISLYARDWLAGKRSLEIERDYPDMSDFFQETRDDPEYAEVWGTP